MAGEIQIRSINGGCNYLSQSELSAHFGLEDADTVDKVRVDWADGRVTVLRHVAANRTLTIAPGSFPGDTNCDGRIDGRDISKFILALIAPAQYEIEMPDCTAENANLNNDAQIDLDDANILIDRLLSAIASAPTPENARPSE